MVQVTEDHSLKIISFSEIYDLIGDDFDAVLDKIETDMLQNGEELQLEVDCLASRVTSEKDSNYKCQFCTKICISMSLQTCPGKTQRHSNWFFQIPDRGLQHHSNQSST